MEHQFLLLVVGVAVRLNNVVVVSKSRVLLVRTQISCGANDGLK
jgi:hypothetical protein